MPECLLRSRLEIKDYIYKPRASWEETKYVPIADELTKQWINYFEPATENQDSFEGLLMTGDSSYGFNL